VEAAHLIPRRIYGVAPGVRLVAILRDPVERAISGYRLARMMGWEHRTPDEAFNEELRPEALERARRFPSDTNSYVVLGEYKRILDGFTDVFDPKQVLIVPFVELQNRPLDVVRRVLRFLGVDVAYVPAGLGH